MPGKPLCQSLFFKKVACPRPATLLEKRLRRRYFSVNFAKFLRTPVFIEHLRWLLLKHLKNVPIENICCYYKWPQIKHLLVFRLWTMITHKNMLLTYHLINSGITYRCNFQQLYKNNYNEIVGHKKLRWCKTYMLLKSIFLFAGYCFLTLRIVGSIFLFRVFVFSRKNCCHPSF